jgi:tetratricopeptide (TPR) repeat protein
MRAIIQRCLEKHPDRRYQDAADVHRALEEMQGLRSVRSLRLPGVPRRPLRNSVLFVVGLLAAGLVWYGLDSPRVANTFSNLQGYSLLEDGRFDEAIEQFDETTRQSPREPNPWDSLGEGYLANGMPERALEAYSRALSLDSGFEPSMLGRGLALAALGRYGEALDRPLPDARAHAFLLSRVGRYREAQALLDNERKNEDAEIRANTALMSAWLLTEQKEYARAIDEVAAAQNALSSRPNHSLLVLGDLIGGIADIRSGNVKNAVLRLDAQRARHDPDYAVEARWVAALRGEVALAEGRLADARSSFESIPKARGWLTLNRDASTVFAISVPSRDGVARVELAERDRAAAIQEYRRLTAVGSVRRTAAALEPRDVLELARQLDAHQDRAAARVEYERFLQLWANADPSLPELSEARTAIAATPR